METVDGRVLPKLGKKGEPPWQAYGHPFEIEPRKVRVSLVIRGLGLSRSWDNNGASHPVALVFRTPNNPKASRRFLILVHSSNLIPRLF